MSAPPAFPVLAGLGWSVHKKPTFASIVAKHVSGREVRDALYRNPIWNFELTFDGLDGAPTAEYGGLGAQSLQTLMGFFLQLQGQFGSFLYTDPSDASAVNQLIATGDGATTIFTFQRTLGGFSEPVGWVTSVTNVFLNGAPASGWTLATPNALTFAAAPSSGISITATFAYAFVCRFDGDDLDFEQFMANLWRAQSVKFRSLRAQ